MRLAVVIPTYGRKQVVNQLLAQLEQQERLPDEVIVSTPSESHVEPYVSTRIKVRYLFGQQGLCAQRNLALDHTLDRFDVVTFFDDDFVPGRNYLKGLESLFESDATLAVVTGNVLKDGATTEGIPFHEAVTTLIAAEQSDSGKLILEDRPSAYGCNMSIRAKHVGRLRFDERLVLYGWQEDTDFTSQLRESGRVVWASNLMGVHLGAKSGKVSGCRFGYSQIVNPIYLIRKGTVSRRAAYRLMARNVLANLVRSIRPETYLDRRGRLLGNVLGMRDVAMGRITPEHAQKL